MDFQQIREFLIPNAAVPTSVKCGGNEEAHMVVATQDNTFQTDDDFVISLISEMNQNSPLATEMVQVDNNTPILYEPKDLITLNPADVTFLAPPALATVGSPSSPSPSEGSSYSYENISSVMSDSVPSPCASDDIISQVVSPAEIFVERKRKRGRKPKSEAGQTLPKVKKIKVYEIEHPLNDKEQERKRLNAVNAKRHRDLQKQAKESMQQQLTDVKNERDMLKKQVELLQQREALLTKQMMAVKEKVSSLWSDLEKAPFAF